MATVRGAKALGRDTGRIAVGATADLILVDFRKPNNYPCHDVVENLVYSSRGSDVTLNMCRGKVIYQDGEFLTIDLEKVMHEMDSYTLPKLFGQN
jgi:5-methylthioadenosine/S-adenosylhomocysteine deaminase